MAAAVMSASEIVSKYAKGRLSSRPEFYAGRGVNHGDLNEQMIEDVYQGILKEISPEAAAHFVNMVADSSMAATTFLLNLEQLELSGWVWDGKPTDSKVSVGKDKDGNYDMINGQLGVMAFLTMGAHQTPEQDKMQSDSIRHGFLAKHAEELTTERQLRGSGRKAFYGCEYGFSPRT